MLASANGLLLTPSAAPRAAPVRMDAAAEAAAKQAWLSKVDTPWGKDGAGGSALVVSGAGAFERCSGMRVPAPAPSTPWGDHLTDYVAPEIAAGAMTPPPSLYGKEQAEGRSGMCVPPGEATKVWGDHLTY